MKTRSEILAKRLQGKRAQKAGASFEYLFQFHARRSGVIATRMPDGCKQVGPGRIIRVRTPWDWILTFQGKSAFIDTKTCDDKCLPNSKIENHQVAPMLQHASAGAIAGYVVHLRQNDTVFFLSASELVKVMRLRGSITEGSPGAIVLGTGGKMDVQRIFQCELREEKWTTKHPTLGQL
jgi:hypothetical protein